MRIALVIERYDPSAGGAERSTAQIAEELVGRGHSVTVVTGRASGAEGVAGLGVESMERSTRGVWNHWRFARWAGACLDAGAYDVSLSVTMAVPATVLQPRGGTIRETLERNVALRPGAVGRGLKRALVALTPKYRAQLALERRTLSDGRVRRVVAVSGYVAEQLRRHYGVEGDRVETIPNAAVMPAVGPEQRAAWRRAVRRAFGVPEGAPVYLFLAMNPRLKGFEPLMRAVRELSARDWPGVVLLAGDVDYPEQALAAELGVRDRVRFVRYTREPAALYAASDVTVLPTFYDPSSKVVIESLMMGVPAITSACNGASDFLGAGGDRPRGVVVADPWDVAGLAGAMAELADPARRAELAGNTAGLGEELSMARHVDRLERVLREAAAEDAAGGEVERRQGLDVS